MKLTAKQARFVGEYLIDLNATAAAIRAGYSARTADRIGSELLRKPHIRSAVDQAITARSEKVRIDAEWVLRRLVDEVEADIASLFDEAGNVKPISMWPKVWTGGLVSGIEVAELFDGKGDQRRLVGYVKKIKFSDRLRRLELLGKHVDVNAFREMVEHRRVAGLADRLERAGRRVEGHDRERR